MKHQIVKVKSVSVLEFYKISVTFDDQTTKIIDLKDVLSGPMFGPLKDPAIFNAVSVDKETATIVWPNGADFDPETLYHWNIYEHELKDRALQW